MIHAPTSTRQLQNLRVRLRFPRTDISTATLEPNGQPAGNGVNQLLYSEFMVTLEENKRLSESYLWQLQLEAYRRAGPTQWVVTNTPILASVYAHFLVSFLRDWQATRPDAPLELEQPLYVLELGAGSGKFSFLFLQALERTLEQTPGPRLPSVCLVMTDNVHEYQDYWKNHGCLQRFLERGVLDFTDFRVDQDHELNLAYSGRTVTVETMANPLMVIANYFFDQIPQDLFRIRNATLEEGLVTLTTEAAAAGNRSLSLLPHRETSVSWRYTFRPTDRRPMFPDDAHFDQILESYLDNENLHVPFSLPTVGLRTIANLLRLSAGKMLFLLGDKGPLSPQEMTQYPCDRLIVDDQGIFSYNVNFDAIRQYVGHTQGLLWAQGESTHRFHVAVCLWGLSANEATHFCSTYAQQIGSFSPADYVGLVEWARDERNSLSMKAFLLLLKLGHFDPALLVACNERTLAEIREAGAELRAELFGALRCAWKNLFCVGPSDEIYVLRIAQLFYLVDRGDVAIECLEQATRSIDGSASLYFYLGRCQQSQQQAARARQSYARALEMNPQHAEARRALELLGQD